MLFLLVLALFSCLTTGQINGVGYIGCYADKQDRDLPFFAGDGYTPPSCNAACAGAGYQFFGLQYGGQCFCGHTFGRHGASNACTMRCSSDSRLLCGEAYVSSVYKVVEPSEQGYLGCYADKDDRDLPFFAGDGYTPSSCNAACGGAGYQFYGLQYAGQCWCGDSFGRHGASNACKLRCSDSRLICGEAYVSSVYKVTGPKNAKEYIGCYADRGDRDLPFLAGLNYVPSTCNDACAGAGYQFFGLQFGNQCYCGQSYGKHGSSNACTKPCTLDSNYLCGELWVSSVYRVTAPKGEGYLGCYADKQDRDLPFYAGDGYIPFTCNAACLKAGYAYFGLQYGSQCYCGQSYGKHGSSSACTMRCSKDTRLICGESWTSSVYKTMRSNGEGYLGCYTDKQDRDLPFFAGIGHTPSTCNDACLKANYAYFGLQYGSQCYCGQSYGKHGPSTSCTMPCHLEPLQTCGELWVNSVYQVINPSMSVIDAKLSARIDRLTHDDLHAGFDVVKEHLPPGLNAAEIVHHIKAKTVPSLTHAQLEAWTRSKSTTNLARRGSFDAQCLKDIAHIIWNVLMVLVDLFGLKGRVLEEPNSLQMSPDEARNLEGALEVIGSSAASMFDRITGVLSLLGGVINALGVSTIVAIFTRDLSFWDAIQFSVTFAAQMLIWIDTDGLGLAGELLLTLDDAALLGLQVGQYFKDGCDQQARLPPPPPPLRLTAGKTVSGRPQLFLIDQLSIVLERHQGPGLNWTDWTPLGSQIPMTRLAVTPNPTGLLEAFALGTNGALYHATQTWTSLGGSSAVFWSDWTSLGGWSSELAVGTNADGRLEAVVLGSGGRPWHTSQLAPGSSSFSDWADLGYFGYEEVSVSQNLDGLLQAFGVSSGEVFTVRQNNWMPGGLWQDIGGGFQFHSMVTSRNTNAIEIFALDPFSRVYHNWQINHRDDVTAWYGWIPLFKMYASQLSVTVQPDGRPIVFAIQKDNQDVHYNVLTPSGWSDWRSLGGSTTSIVAMTTKDGFAQVYAIFGGEKNIFVRQQLSPSDPHAWTNWTPLN